MLRLIISGCNGHMGRVVESICRGEADVEIAAGFDLLGQGERDYPVYSSPAEFTGEASVIIDFSHPSALPALLELGVSQKIPLVLATTGYSPADLSAIDQAAKSIPIFRSANMSLGVYVLVDLI